MRDFANSLALSHKKECGIKGKLRPPWRRGNQRGIDAPSGMKHFVSL